MDSVRTHAVYQMILVGHRLYVKQSCTDQSVNVPLDGLEILTLSVSPVSLPFNHLYFWPCSLFSCSIVDECKVNADCPLDKACVSNECINPCRQTSCGDRAECKVDYHQSRCVCPPGLQGNPIVKCVSVECHDDNDCSSDEKCNPLSNRCFPVCQEERCGADEAICSGVNHRKVCTCPPHLLGDGNVYCGLKRKNAALTFSSVAKFFTPLLVFVFLASPIEGCRVDGDCPSQQSCFEFGNCRNPCTSNNPCESDQQCTVVDTLPTRTVSCMCPEGSYVGNSGRCETTVAVPECTEHPDCRNNEVCHTGSCIDACLVLACGSGAICSTTLHDIECSCPPGYTGDPREACLLCKTPFRPADLESPQFCIFPPFSVAPIEIPSLPIGCTTDDNCPEFSACLNQRCEGPCSEKTCGRDSECQVVKHEVVCTCPDGYVGSPLTSCEKRKFDMAKKVSLFCDTYDRVSCNHSSPTGRIIILP